MGIEKNYVTWSSEVVTLHLVLVGWLCQEGFDGKGMGELGNLYKILAINLIIESAEYTAHILMCVSRNAW
jgi:hypothetical protein